MRNRHTPRYSTQQVGVFFIGIAIGLIVGIVTGEIVTWTMAGVVLGAAMLAMLSIRPR